MRVRGATGLAAAMLVLVAGTASAANQSSGLTGVASAKFEQLEQAFPGARVHVEGTNIKMVYGVPMNGGATPDAAAEAWLANYASVWGVNASELEVDRVNEIVDGRFTVIAYKQTMNGLPVENGIARIVVNNALGKVVLASSKLAARPAEGFAAVAMDAEQAVQIAGAHPMFRDFGDWTIPELVVWADADGRRTTEAWKFEGGRDLPGDFQWRTFFVDTATGAILEARDEVYTIDVSGNVQGFGSPGLFAHSGSNPPANLAMPKIRMTITGGSNAFTATNGNYVIANPGSSAVTVTSNLSAGQWVNVNPNGVAELSVSGGVTPPGPGNFVFNAGSSDQANVAQVNAFIHTTLTHDYIKDRAPSFTGLDIVIPANTGVSGSCNAFFTTSGGPSINFYNSGGSCNNTSFSTVIAHEYGHFIVNRLGLSQNAFGEGFGDVMAIMMYDTGIVGQGFQTSGGAVRNPGAANQQYPCTAGAIHNCGQILGGTWYELTELFQSHYGTATGLSNAQNLNVGWAMITVGGSGTFDSAHPATAIEVLTIDDTNGNLNDGTPNYSRICNAFGQHGISCPALQLLSFTYPDGQPQILSPGQATTFPLVVGASGATPTPGTGSVIYTINGGTPSMVGLTQTSANNYTVALPAVNCGDEIEYYVRVSSSAGFVYDPTSAETSGGPRYAATAAYGSVEVLNDTMESNLGWTAGMTGDNATTGIWTRVNPVGTAAQPEDDHTPTPGTICWVTGQGSVGGGVGDNDVDSGTTTLLSPVLNLAGSNGAKVSYWRWYSNDEGAAPSADTFVIQVTNDGTNWTTVETVGPSGTQASGGWFFNEFNVSDFVTPTANVRVRFRASDLGSGSIVEAAVDDFLVTTIDCTSPCAADVNGGGLDVTDLLDFLDAFGTCEGQPAPCSSGGVSGDFNGDTIVDVLDFLDYLDAFGTGCAG